MTSSGLFVAYLKISSKKLHFQVQNCTCSIGIPIRAMYYRVPLSSPSIKCLRLFYTPEALCISQLQVWWITTLRICEMARLIHFLQGWNFHGLPWSCKRKLKKKNNWDTQDLWILGQILGDTVLFEGSFASLCKDKRDNCLLVSYLVHVSSK